MKLLLFLSAAMLITSCGPSRFIEPLEKDQLAVGVSLGGPFIDFAGTPIPVPLTQLEVGYGLRDDLTLHGGLHTTALFFGNAQIDVGVTYLTPKLKGKWTPHISLAPSVNFIYDFNDRKAKLWPILDVNAYYNYGKRRNYFYFGINNYFDFAGIETQGRNRYILLSPQVGHVFKGKERGWELFTEIKFIAPYLNSASPFVPYKGITGENGATGFYFGFRKMLNTKKKES
tara:strand:- start:4190 stop:4876 length:687 start_codon:yes stop_codon:yes gene_type:complete